MSENLEELSLQNISKESTKVTLEISPISSWPLSRINTIMILICEISFSESIIIVIISVIIIICEITVTVQYEESGIVG